MEFQQKRILQLKKIYHIVVPPTPHACPFPCLVREKRSLKNVQISTHLSFFLGVIYVKISLGSIDFFAIPYGTLKQIGFVFIMNDNCH